MLDNQVLDNQVLDDQVEIITAALYGLRMYSSRPSNAMDNRDKWRERVREIRANGMMMMIMMMESNTMEKSTNNCVVLEILCTSAEG